MGVVAELIPQRSNPILAFSSARLRDTRGVELLNPVDAWNRINVPNRKKKREKRREKAYDELRLTGPVFWTLS